MIIADTNVVSEFMRDTPDPVVMAWAGTLAPAELTICVVTVLRDLARKAFASVEAAALEAVNSEIPANKQVKVLAAVHA